ncbi:aminodeoxychorismate synthase component 1 [Rouxiella sp. Mn2063]|uniref:aminodeoxychorismate synthase component 1 n=1 Tax=Rouxiella sp. Mn2063 TaxID=3395262 RepID=UPI003BD186F7
MPANHSIVYHPLPYHPDVLLERFAPLSATPWAMLLHSGAAQHAHSRFDILVADPIRTLTTHGEETEIWAQNQTLISADDPFTLVEQQLAQAGLQATPHADYPFQGGVMGLFGYDLGRRIEQLPILAERDINLPDMAVGIYDWALIADHQRQCLTLVCQGDAQARLAWLSQQQSTPQRDFMLDSAWQSNMSRQQYGEKFRQVQEYLQSGDCYQINLTQRFSSTYHGDEWQAFLRLNQANSAPFSAFLRLPENTVLSLSPERFLWMADHQVQTRPIKGTLPRLADAKADSQQAEKLAASAKDRSENLMIVDLLRNDIGRVATPGSVRVPELFVVEQFPAVHHLVSTITATLPTACQPTALLRACFPGGSITGAPKIRAMQIIEQLEPQRRNGYCGSIAYISCCGTMDSNITIRTLLTEQGRIYCWAGGGVVADSEEQAEYQETFDKVGRILPLLGINRE